MQESEAMVEISLKLSKIYTNQKKYVIKLKKAKFLSDIYLLSMYCYRYELADTGFEWCVTTAEKICVQTSRDENRLMFFLFS